MLILIVFQCCQQQSIYAHALRLSIFLDLLTLTLGNIHTDIIVMTLEVFSVRGGFLPRWSAVLAIFLRTRGHSESLTAERTDLFAADLHSCTRFFLLFVRLIAQDLHLITAVLAVFRTVRCCLELHAAHLTIACKHHITSGSLIYLFYQILSAKSSITANLLKYHWGKAKKRVLFAAHRQKQFSS